METGGAIVTTKLAVVTTDLAVAATNLVVVITGFVVVRTGIAGVAIELTAVSTGLYLSSSWLIQSIPNVDNFPPERTTIPTRYPSPKPKTEVPAKIRNI